MDPYQKKKKNSNEKETEKKKKKKQLQPADNLFTVAVITTAEAYRSR